MGHTNETANYNLPQFIGTDKPTWLGDVNGAMSAIDAAIANAASAATDAASVATNAATVASGAVTTANAASETATAASTAASGATTTANNAAETANNAQSTAVLAKGTADGAASAIGDLSDLTTTDKTNLVSAVNEVKASIPAAGGSVSVTADGVKTFGALLDELNALIDATKISVHSILTRETSPNGGVEIARAHIENASAGDYGFTTTSISVSGADMLFASNEYRCKTTGSLFLQYSKLQNATETFTDTSATVATNGIKITIYY